MRFQFIDAEKANHNVAILCRLLRVSRSGYYGWRDRAPSARAKEDGRLRVAVRAAHRRSHGTYGAPRVHAELVEQGHQVSRKRVARLLREEGLEGRTGRRGCRTTRPDPTVVASDLVGRDFTAEAPNQVWVADTTYLHCVAGFVFLVAILDLFSRRVVGWAVDEHHDAELVICALRRAVALRGPTPGLIFHSDRGSEFTAELVTRELERMGAQRSLGRVGDCYDNAVAERFFGTMKGDTGIMDGLVFDDLDDARAVVGSYIEAFYNRERRHSANGQQSPARYEARLHRPPLAA